MNNLKVLITQPKEYFKGMNGYGEKKEPIKLRYLFGLLIIVSLIVITIQSSMVPESLSVLNELASDYKILLYMLIAASCIFFTLVGAWVCVNVLYLFTKILLNAFEGRSIEDKKYFKNLLYVRYIITSIVTLSLLIIVGLIIKDKTYYNIISSINKLFIKFWSAYMLYGVLKFYLNTVKIQKIVPTVLYIFTIIGFVCNLI
ncbi:hypothetical protein [Paraclostridium sordellii]|uniref:Yip1 domain-containing protein n=1 Tax=Paraclostridium sordellii TaxID=1505 RepID=A0A0C7GBH7_PARSO|nr:hypothetical protein [Paeniclostridium sordellii]QYE97973.1 hypothetical protein KZ987_17480 [Paeniclostridium sordellii]CEN80558.1 Uncharacterised protein [[Clostridium] sordellii] [Paeniclostridium sordellii]CEP98350.1 Uncharacterised protein [[Clostridium] sordellii] [Paeniclostridium sordellii]CEQ05392.1 Uncharacterised protein [[Clostridium] sordellii] [Paeniclostridium sordellii]